ncbi:hypothetical protein V6N13_029319 [Hibiscus sabdariffa]
MAVQDCHIYQAGYAVRVQNFGFASTFFIFCTDFSNERFCFGITFTKKTHCIQMWLKLRWTMELVKFLPHIMFCKIKH